MKCSRTCTLHSARRPPAGSSCSISSSLSWGRCNKRVQPWNQLRGHFVDLINFVLLFLFFCCVLLVTKFAQVFYYYRGETFWTRSVEVSRGEMKSNNICAQKLSIHKNRMYLYILICGYVDVDSVLSILSLLRILFVHVLCASGAGVT